MLKEIVHPLSLQEFITQNERSNIPQNVFLKRVHFVIRQTFMELIQTLLLENVKSIKEWSNVLEKTDDIDITFQTSFVVTEGGFHSHERVLKNIQDVSKSWTVLGAFCATLSNFIQPLEHEDDEIEISQMYLNTN
jgi:hypothetical protein